MDTYHKLIQEIRNRPGLYLQTVSLTNFEMFILGYKTALECHRITPPQDDFSFDEFTNWLHNKYTNAPRNQNWAFVIKMISENEEKGFNKFLELFDEYNQENY